MPSGVAIDAHAGEGERLSLRMLISSKAALQIHVNVDIATPRIHNRQLRHATILMTGKVDCMVLVRRTHKKRVKSPWYR